MIIVCGVLMQIVLTEDCQNQIAIIGNLRLLNKEYSASYMRIALYVDALQKQIISINLNLA